jgi:transcriptional regulator with XRE-family HTH domain
VQEIDLALIKSRRKEMRLTLQDMADELGFNDASTYWKYEKGMYKFKADHVPVVAAKLKIKMKDIFFSPGLAKIAK